MRQSNRIVQLSLVGGACSLIAEIGSEYPNLVTETTTITLAGIGLEIHNPDRYLEALWHVLHETKPVISSVLLQIQQLLGRSPQEPPANDERMVSHIVGYHGEAVTYLIDREWHESEENEFDVLLEYFQSQPVLDTHGSVFLFGAGACRLGDYLASLDTGRSVVCSDLSWIALYFGKALIENRPDLLPGILQSERLHYGVGDGYRNLSASYRPSRFKSSFAGTGNKIQYAVRNAFYRGAPIASDVVYIPFLLDEFSGTHGITMLIRMCQQMRAGQTLVVFMTCMTGGPREDSRNPAGVLTTLARCGFRIEYADLVLLPYSFTRYDYGYNRTTWNTLVVRAVCTRDEISNSIAVMSTVDKENSTTENDPQLHCYTIVRDKHRMNRVTLLEDSIAALSRCSEGGTYSEITKDLQKIMEPDRVERAIGDLTSSDLVRLSVP